MFTLCRIQLLPEFDPNEQLNNVAGRHTLFGVRTVDILRWMYVFCTAMSILLLLLDMRKARKIVRSRDISLAFTHSIAYRYFSIQWFPYYAFFDELSNMTKLKDKIALFVFFRLRGRP